MGRTIGHLVRSRRRRIAAAIAVAACGCVVGAPAGSARAADVFWAVDANGQWTAASNWSSNPSLPGPADDVSINRSSGDYLITLGNGSQTINSLVCNERFSLVGGTLSLASASSFTNTFALS